MLQRDQLFEWRSILRNTLLGPEIQHSSHKDKRKARKTASEMLTRYDLGGFLGAKPSELSGRHAPESCSYSHTDHGAHAFTSG